MQWEMALKANAVGEDARESGSGVALEVNAVEENSRVDAVGDGAKN